MIIDAHHHFWRYDPGEYDWIDEDMAGIRRDFLPLHLAAELETTDVDGVITVQARQTHSETDWLLQLAEQHDFILGVVGWVDLLASDIAATLERYAPHPALVGVRHVVQTEGPGFLLAEAFNRGLALLQEFDLRYDLLIHQDQAEEALLCVDRHPEQVFILDHIAKPAIARHELHPWARQLRALAQRPNVYCKLSGLVTEANYEDWSVSQLHPYMETALEAFGPERLMFGSDWPVCLLACSYARWLLLVQDFAAGLSEDERTALFAGTARRAYDLRR